MKKRLKAIIDMDIGDDIDDAFALLLAMKLNIEIIGITTVFKNTAHRARITKKMLSLFGNGYESVPVFAGYGTPLSKKQEKFPTLMCQYTTDLEDPSYAPNSENPEDAVNFIIESCKKYKDELTVIAIGPFTNIAMAAIKDKDALNLAKELVIMGGAYFKQYVDWNVMCDVEAADIMFNSVNNIKCIGADVTHKLRLSDDDDRKICEYSGNSPLLSYVSEIYKLWKSITKAKGFLHDPLTVYYAHDKSICECEQAPVFLFTEGMARGLTLNVTAYQRHNMNSAYEGFDFSKKHTLAREVDRERMISEFIKCFD